MELSPGSRRMNTSGRTTPVLQVASPESGRSTPAGRITPVFTWSPLPHRKPIFINTSPTCSQKQKEAEGEEELYPNCDVSIWLRTCTQEVIDPLEGTITGCIPKWLKGTLLRNGPGKLQVGETTYKHLFDSAALLHRFAINNGEITYQCRFLQSNTYKKNLAAQRIVVTEFGTKAVPDPCQSIFQRVASIFDPGESMSDNAMISVYPFGDEFYTFTESPVIHRINPSTLETVNRVNVSKYVGIVNHTSHPHVMSDGTVYNLGMTITGKGPHYCIIEFPPPMKSDSTEYVSSFDQASIVASIPARWPLHPSYMHTFGVTENYFVIVEQPLSVSVPAMVKSQINNEPMAANLRWYQDEQTLIHLIRQEDGEHMFTFLAEAFFYLHIINAFESDDHLVLDICCYRDAAMLECMYVDALQNCHKNPDYARMFRSRPLRFVLPLQADKETSKDKNLVNLKGTKATAYRLQSGDIFVKPELLCDLGCETPQLHYEECLGRPYRYFYAISSDVDLDNPGTLIKVDTLTRQRKTWCEENVFPSEPIFVKHPTPQNEDHGVILSSIVWGNGNENKAGLLILDATTFQELGRAVFVTPSPVPKCLHGWFTDTVS